MAEDIRDRAEPNAVLDKAVLSVLDRLQLRQAELSAILGLSPAAVSRAVRTGIFATVGKSREHQVLLVRLDRALDSIVGGDDAVAAAWLRNDNVALGAAPIERMKHSAGLVDVLAYLDSRRAPI